MTSLSADVLFNFLASPCALLQFQNATDGQGVDIILENLANVNLGADLKLLSRFGRVMVSVIWL